MTQQLTLLGNEDTVKTTVKSSPTIKIRNGGFWDTKLRGTIKRIHVNQHVIKSNAKNGGSEPVLTVKTTRANKRCNEVIIHGPSRVIYSPNKPLSCGAKVWIETHAVVDSVINDGPVLRIVEEVK